jgi:hypothetical protein
LIAIAFNGWNRYSGIQEIEQKKRLQALDSVQMFQGDNCHN